MRSDDRELEAANRVAHNVGARLEVIDISDTIKALGGKGPLIHSEASILKFGNCYVLSIAIAYALESGYTSIAVALHGDDAAESLEYTRAYMDRIEALAQFAYPKLAPKILTPFLTMNKIEVFQLGKKLGLDFSLTWSCIRGEKIHCGLCGACRARRRAFNMAGITDPTIYENQPQALESVQVA